MGGMSQGRLNLRLVKMPELSDKTYLVGYGPLLVCSCVPLLGTVIAQRRTEKKISIDNDTPNTTCLKYTH